MRNFLISANGLIFISKGLQWVAWERKKLIRILVRKSPGKRSLETGNENFDEIK
jgi:hypothetical protein